MTTSSGKYDHLIEIWKSLPPSFPAASLEGNFINPMLQALGVKITEFVQGKSLGVGAGLIPDYLVWQNGINASNLSNNPPNIPPILVIEDKLRVPHLATASDSSFIQQCENSVDYLSAIQGNGASNGLKQYLDVSNLKIDRNMLASYGLVLNGDFFQLWRRVDGLIFPLTPIQRIKPETIPELMKQLEYVLKNPQPALVTAVWNRKGGVGKTTNTLNIGATLALKGKRVLLLDWDTQTDLTMAFKIDSETYHYYLTECLKNIYKDEYEVAYKIAKSNIKTARFKNTNGEKFTIDILPSNRNELYEIRDSSGSNKDKSQTSFGVGKSQKIKCLQKLISLLSDDYDYVFIDSSPASDVLSISTLLSIDTILISTDYSKKTLFHAVNLYQHEIPQIFRANNLRQSTLGYRPWNLGLLFSNCPGDAGSSLEKCIQEELDSRGFIGNQCKTRLKIYAQTKIAEFKHLPVVCWSKSPITQLYAELVDEVFLSHNFINQ
ncbi:MAG: AAA family ATPase [Synechocystis sp.]|nr:AAA family ATPase [Synechocystis sp.]